MIKYEIKIIALITTLLSVYPLFRGDLFEGILLMMTSAILAILSMIPEKRYLNKLTGNELTNKIILFRRELKLSDYQIKPDIS